MIRKLGISLICFATTWSASVEGQVIQPGAEPQPLPGAPAPDFQSLRRRPRMRPENPPPAARPTTLAPTAPAASRQAALSAFVVPAGLSEPINYLLSDLGYESGRTFPLTPRTTFDVAYKCYADGRYSDAMVFASHGLRMCNDARLHLIKGVCELHRGLGAAAEMTAVDFRNAIAGQQVFGMEAARERISDTMSVRFADLVEYQVTGH
jgi:hypothetical protein